MGLAAINLHAMAAVIIAPSFNAVLDVYCEAHRKLKGSRDMSAVELQVNEDMHDTERHFAACYTTGKRIDIAPEGADLPLDTLTAILAHELGHASDFLHPGRWEFVSRDKPAKWVDSDAATSENLKGLQRRWMKRSDDEIEWCADAIAYAVTGRRVGYCGPCLLQCFDSGVLRPTGLR
jgi:hypothetical protein